MAIERSEASDALASQHDDHLTAIGDMPHIPAQVVVKLTHPYLILDQVLWRHENQYTHHMDAKRPSTDSAANGYAERCRSCCWSIEASLSRRAFGFFVQRRGDAPTSG